MYWLMYVFDVSRDCAYILIDTKEVVHLHLGDHGCLNLDDPSTQMLGGPTRSVGGNECEKFAVTPHSESQLITR